MIQDTDWADRLAAIEARVKRLEDELTLLRLINTWGPAVDTGAGEAAATLWDHDGVMETHQVRLDSPADIAAIVTSAGQQALIRQGCAHIPSCPLVNIDGDRATADGYMIVYLRTEDGWYKVWAVSASHWEFARTPSGWRMTRAVGYPIDGGPAAREILADALEEPRNDVY